MNRDQVRRSIAELGYEARLEEVGSKLIVEFAVLGRKLTLAHSFPDNLLRVPQFFLLNGHGFGKLAHVLTNENGDGGEVCVADPTSTAVNTDRPELTYRATVEEHVQLLTKLIEDPAYNREEQLREFDAHWGILCDDSRGGRNEIFVAWDGDAAESLQVKPPQTNSGRSAKSGSGLKTRPIALASSLVNHARLASIRDSAGWNMRQFVGKALAAPLNGLDPPPAARSDLLPWFFSMVDHMDEAGRHLLQRFRTEHKREFWLVFSAPVPDGETMFALHWRTPNKSPLPSSARAAEAARWTVTPHLVRSLSRRSLVPRGGGSMDLRGKSVLLVGCGSVGAELALRLTSAGVGRLTVSDPDTMSEENLYRHTLSVSHIGQFKARALVDEVAQRHPWAEVTHWSKSLEDLREPDLLRQFDLITIAIGVPNVERYFAEYCAEEPIDVPVITCWLEGYGIGGHAILVLPGTKGCWHCAYVDPQTLSRGLVSNLNFLVPDQVIMRNQGGCGTQFLPYSGIAAGYTASIAADLAVRFLEDQVPNSAKVSWKGSSVEAERNSLAVTWRYRHFTESLRILPLHDVNCDLCVV